VEKKVAVIRTPAKVDGSIPTRIVAAQPWDVTDTARQVCAQNAQFD
jgi:hypothetical protein